MTDDDALAPAPATEAPARTEPRQKPRKPIFGRGNTTMENHWVNQVFQALPHVVQRDDESVAEFSLRSGMGLVAEFNPADGIEAMLAGQAVAMNAAAMECLRRAALPNQPFEIADKHRRSAANMSRTFIELLAALDRKRGKGSQQRVTVEHVHVHAGGQAIVGAVTGGRPDAEG